MAEIQIKLEAKTVAELIEALQHFPPEARAYGYEGEITGVVVTLDGRQLGYVIAEDDPMRKMVL